MALVGPPPLLNAKPLAVLKEDLRDERAATVPFPPGETSVSLIRTRRFACGTIVEDFHLVLRVQRDRKFLRPAAVDANAMSE